MARARKPAKPTGCPLLGRAIARRRRMVNVLALSGGALPCSQADLARAIEVSVSAVKHWEGGRKHVPLHLLRRIEAALSCSFQGISRHYSPHHGYVARATGKAVKIKAAGHMPGRGPLYLVDGKVTGRSAGNRMRP